MDVKDRLLWLYANIFGVGFGLTDDGLYLGIVAG